MQGIVQSIFAQCPPSVSIGHGSTVNSPAQGCVATMDTFWALPINGGPSPTYAWHYNGTLVGISSVLIHPVYAGYYNNTFSVTMNSNDSCASQYGPAYAYFYPNPPVSNISMAYRIHHYCTYTTITYMISSYDVDTITFATAQWYIPGISYANNSNPEYHTIAVSPRGTISHPTLDSITITYNQVGDGPAISQLSCLDISLGCSFYYNGDTIPLYGDTSINQTICLIPYDTSTNFPQVIWDKSDKYATDSFYISRAVGPYYPYAQFTRVAAIGRDELSVWEDYGAYISNSGSGYAISVLDTCGGYSYLSPQHWPVHLSYVGSGNFLWSPYIIENNTMPIGTYGFYRDAQGNGNWQLLTNLVDTQLSVSSISDPAYASYPNARYRVELTTSISCNPSRAITAISSNIVNNRYPTGVSEIEATNQILVYPNPVYDNVTISCPSLIDFPVTVTITDLLGQNIYSALMTRNILQVNTQNWLGGVYLVTVIAGNSKSTVRLVKL